MNEILNLVEILKDCPKGTKLYSTIHGEVEFNGINNNNKIYKIKYETKALEVCWITPDGKILYSYDGECILFPSKDQRDWSKFTAPWYKKERFDPKTLKPFDRVLVRNENYQVWQCDLFSHIKNGAFNLCIDVLVVAINAAYPTTMTPSIL